MPKDRSLPKNGVLVAGTELASIDKVSVIECTSELLIYFYYFAIPN
jgi:hypothetical protein